MKKQSKLLVLCTTVLALTSLSFTKPLSAAVHEQDMIECDHSNDEDVMGVGEYFNEGMYSDYEKSLQNKNYVLPPEAKTFKINVTFVHQGFTSKDKQKVLQAASALEKVIASSAYMNKILNYKFNGRPGFESSSHSPRTIYSNILSGAEKLDRSRDNEMDLFLGLENPEDVGPTTVAITATNSKVVRLNTKYLRSSAYGKKALSQTLMHEWLHKIGYGHAKEQTPTRPYSVPYGIGSIVKSLVK